MASNADQIRAARAQKTAENQSHRAAKKNKGKTVVVATDAPVLSYNEKIVAAAVAAELEKALVEKGDVLADSLARNTRFWMDFAQIKYTAMKLQAFAAAEAARWYEVRHPRPAKPAGGKRDGFGGGGDRGRR